MPPKPSTPFALSADLEAFIADQVECGRYDDASEVVSDALQRLQRELDAYEAKLCDEGIASGISPLSHEEVHAEALRVIRARERGKG